MQNDIRITLLEENNEFYVFEVEVIDSHSKTTHEVKLNKDFYKTLKTATPPIDIVEKSFDFLLKRESKEAILEKFDLRDINNYFPEYEAEIISF